MANWVFQGLVSGVVTTKYPRKLEAIPGGWPGLPVGGPCPDDCRACREVCPVGAVARVGGEAVVDYKRCIFCRQCVDACKSGVLTWRDDFRTAVSTRPDLPARFSRRSVYIRHVDAGACECCLWEVGALSHPYYDLHRLGFFFVPSPRHADILLVSGRPAVNMAGALEKTWQAMPHPKKVVAVGGCACGGGTAGYAAPVGLAEVLPVDVFIPGCPPAPLTLLHGLLVATGRAEGVSAQAGTPAGPERTKAARS